MQQATRNKVARRSNAKKQNGRARPQHARRKKRGSAADPLFSNRGGFCDSGPADLARNHDKYLTAILVYEHERGKRR